LSSVRQVSHLVNLARLAEEVGCLGIRVERPDEIAPAIRRALAADCLAVMEVMTDANCPAPEPWTP
jgi:acetolactate synthase I/II/III large subunit